MWSSSRGWVFLAGALLLLVLVGGWFKLRTGIAGPAQDQSGMASSPSAARRERGGEGHSARQVADTWFAAALASQPGGQESSVITITSQDSPARRAAFRDLLGRVDRSNAAALHDLMSDAASHGEAGAFNDGEWKAFLEKWGRLDGPAAVWHLEENGALPTRSPAVLGGWSKVDPAAAAAWFESISLDNPDAPWLSAGCRELILGWLEVDAGEAAAWLDGDRERPGYQEASARIAAGMFSSDRDMALSRAGSLKGPWADWAYGEIERQWLVEAPDEARAAFTNAGYEKELIDQIAAPETSGIDLLRLPVGGPGDAMPWSTAEKWGIHVTE